jgi:hypothetical protein
MHPLILCLALTPGAASHAAGPALPAVKGLMKPLKASADVKDMVQWSLGEMGQAVVVVEGELAMLPKVATPGIRVFDGKLRLFTPKLPRIDEIPMPYWVNPNVTMAGGNVVQKIYPMGWGY